MNEVDSNQSSAAQRKGELCVWIMPPGTGRAKRVRLGLPACAVAAVGIFAFVAVLGFTVGDYARLQYQRARNYLHVRTLAAERNNLKQANDLLKDKLGALSSAADMQQGLKARLDELASVVGAMKTYGVVSPEDQAALSQSPNSPEIADDNAKAQLDAGADEGMGGAEIDCSGDPTRCVAMGLPGAMDEGTGLGAGMTLEPAPDLKALLERKTQVSPSLLNQLDDYIELLKAIPFSAPTVGDVTSNFGFRRSPFTHSLTVHEGVDYAVSYGTHVVTTGDGLVREVRRNPTYGLVIDIEHSPNVVTRYAHLSKAFVTEGERVCRGETIGLTGSTGRSTGPHLHYEVRVNGQPQNPARLLALGSRLASLFQS